MRVKGKADPVPVWRLEGARSRTGIEAVRRAGTPFVGRQAELDLLKGLFERTLTDRTVRLVTVVGEPGVGKSRFVGELAASVDDRRELVTWRQGRCLPYGDGITFWALGEIVKAQAGVLESDPPAQVSDKLRGGHRPPCSPTRSEREWLRARLAPLLGIADADAVKAERAELFAAWRRFVEAMAAPDPLVLVVEDLHWADPAMLEFLEHLVERSADLPLLIVATARPELLERHPAWGEANPAATRIPLGPLTDLGAARLVAALVGPGGAARRRAGPAAGAGRRQPAVRRGVRAAAGRPGPGGRRPGRGHARHPRPRDRPRADRGPPRHPHPRGQGAGPGRRRGRPGLLAGRRGRHGRRRARRRAGGPCRPGRAGAQAARPAGADLLGPAPGRVRVLARPGQGRGLRPDSEGGPGPPPPGGRRVGRGGGRGAGRRPGRGRRPPLRPGARLRQGGQGAPGTDRPAGRADPPLPGPGRGPDHQPRPGPGPRLLPSGRRAGPAERP